MEDNIEKAKVDHNDGDVHQNGKWVWDSSKKHGAGDWKAMPKTTAGTDTSTTGATKKVLTSSKSAITDPAKLKIWAETTTDDNLKIVANSLNGSLPMILIAVAELKSRGFDVSTLKTTGKGTYAKYLAQKADTKKLLGDDSDTPADGTSSQDAGDDNGDAPAAGDTDSNIGDGTDVDAVSDKWYLNKKTTEFKKHFNLDSKSGRIKYDQFLDRKKRKEPNYQPPPRVMQILARQYLFYLSNPKARFMISAGGAGVGKTYTFKRLCKNVNKIPFDAEKHKPGDGDYDYFEAPNVGSYKQLGEVLKAHNGKILLFDDNDSVLTDKRCSAMMKKACATNGERIVDDPDDKTINFKFTGRIMVMTNKDLSGLSENADTRAIISRATQKSEIHFTVPETLEVLKTRFQSMEFDTIDRMDDPEEDATERDEVLDLVKEHIKNIDPNFFTVRTFEEMIMAKRAAENGNDFVDDPTFSDLIGDYKTDWKEDAVAILTKSEDDELGIAEEVEVKKAEEVEDAMEKALKDDFNLEDMSLEKAEDLLFD